MFTEVEDSGLDFTHWNGRSGRLYYVEVVGAGGALLDYDNDGDLDVYLVQGALLGADRTMGDALVPWHGEDPPRDRLFRNDGALRFSDVTEKSGIRATGYGMGAAAADVDNDGDTDLYVMNFGRNELWRNQGDGTFVEVGSAAGVADERFSVSASFTDYDSDGDLDLFVVNYLDYTFLNHKTCLTERGEPDYCLPSAYRPVADALYRNLGDGTFEDVSEKTGISARAGNGLGVVAADFDGDQRVDFYVANDLQPNHLWLSRDVEGDGGVRFVEDALAVGVALNKQGKAEASMGVTTGDFDADGDLDLFMTHFRRESNTLYVNQGLGFFEDATRGSGLGDPSWDHTAFGTGFLDYDNDGLLDVVVANGAVTFRVGISRGPADYPLDEPNQLFRNIDGRSFADVTDQAGSSFGRSEVSRGILVGDLDNDGDSDLVVTNNSGRARILRNDVGSQKGWLGLRPVVRTASGAERDAPGASIRAGGEGERLLLRRSHSDGGYASANDPRVLLGLGDRSAPLDVLVTWPDGTRESFAGLELRRYHRLLQGAGNAVEGPAGSAQDRR